MKIKHYIFTVLLLALTTMPVNVFADIKNKVVGLQAISPEIQEEANRIIKESEYFHRNQYDAVLRSRSITVYTRRIQNHAVIRKAVDEWKKACEKATPFPSSDVKNFKAKEKPSGSNTVISCVVNECTDSFKYKVSKDESMCEMTKEYEKQLDKERKEQKAAKNEKQNAEIEKVVKEIETATKNVTIGSSVNVPTKFFDADDNVTSDDINDAFTDWETECGKIRTSEITGTDVDDKKIAGNYKFTCIITECNKSKGLEPSNDGRSCEKTNEQKASEKEQELENQKDICGGKDGTWDDKKGCLCNGKKMKDDESECVPDKSKEACEKATDADWKINKCVCKDKNLEWSNQELKCVKKSGTCKDLYGKGVGEYDENGKCKLTNCESDQYTLNPERNKCELKTTANIRDKNQQNKQDKEFSSDVAKFISAFNSVVNTKKTEYCETQKQTKQEQQGDQS